MLLVTKYSILWRPSHSEAAVPTMTIFEPLFILCVLATVGVLILAAIAMIRGHRSQAVSKLKTLGIAAALYMGVVLAVAIASPRKTYAVGQMQCFDDWCITTTSARRTPQGTVEVNLRLSSRAKRVAQRELGTVVYLVDAQGRRFDPAPDPAIVPLDTRLQPGEAVDAPRRFDVPADARDLGLVYKHEGGFPIQFFIIGENDSIHGPAIVRLDSSGSR